MNNDTDPSLEEQKEDSFIFETYLSLLMFWTLCITVLIGFISRYIFNNSLTWTEEISRYLLIIVVFFGSAVAISKKSHIAIEFFYYKFKKKNRFLTSLFIDAIYIAFCLFCVFGLYEITLETKEQYMVSLDIPKSYLYFSVFVGFSLMSIRLILRLITNIKNKKGL